MEMNSSTLGHVDEVPPQQTASGWSIFWALLAIVSNAMLQVSFTGYLWNGNTFEGSLWPHRSSPFVCLVDAAADIYVGFQALRNHDSNQWQSETTSVRDGSLTRLALFCLGVMPQAIKLFSMQGIPGTQAIAAMFLLSSSVSLICSLILESPQREIQKLLGSLDGSGLRSQHFLEVTVSVLGWCPHLVGIFLLWHRLVDKVGFAPPADVTNAVEWVCLIIISLAFVYIIQHTVFILLDKKPPVPRYPIIIILTSTNAFCIPDMFATPGKRLGRGLTDRLRFTIELLVSLGLACYIAATVLHYLVDRVYKRCKSCRRLYWRITIRQCSVADSNSSSATTEGTALEDLRTADTTEPPIHCAIDSTRASTASLTPSHPPGTISDQNVGPVSESPTPPNQTPANSSNEDTLEGINQVHSINPQAISSTPEPPQANAAGVAASSWSDLALKLLENVMARIIIPILAVVLLAMLYSGCWKPGERDDTIEQQRTAEEGVVGTSAAATDQAEQPRVAASPPQSSTNQRSLTVMTRLAQSALRVLDTILRFVLKWILTLIWRLIVAHLSLFGYTFNWVKWQVTKHHPPETLMVAFGFVNFVTAVVYYLVFFNEDGTVMPGWANIFG